MKKYLRFILVIFLLGTVSFFVFYKFWKKDDNVEIRSNQDEMLKSFSKEIKKEEEIKYKEEYEKEELKSELEEKIYQYAKEGNVKEWEKLTNRHFELNDYDNFDVNVKGYLMKGKFQSYGDQEVSITYFVINSYSDESFYEVIDKTTYNFEEDFVNPKTNGEKIIVLGCYENGKIKSDGKGDAGENYIDKEVEKSLLNSSFKNQVEINLLFRSKVGFGCLCCNEPYQIRKAE